MTINKVFDSISEIVKGIEDIYQYFLEYFYDNPEHRTLWEDMLQGEEDQFDMVNRCTAIVSSLSYPNRETIGKDVNYGEIMTIIDGYKREIKEDLDITRALKTAFHLELLEIDGIFNEVIKLPQEPYFDILSEMHLETRRNMGRLIAGIEKFSTDKEFLFKVLELKVGIIERRAGTDRRAGESGFEGADRRDSERRQERLVKIACKI